MGHPELLFAYGFSDQLFFATLPSTSLAEFHIRARTHCHVVVAQICNLLYRRFEIGGVFTGAPGMRTSSGLQTRDTSD